MPSPVRSPSPTRPAVAQRVRPVAALVGSILSLTLGAAFAKHLFPLVGAQGTTAVRVTFAALLLCAIWRPWRRRPTRRDMIRVALYGAVLGAMNLCFYMSLRTIPIGVAIAIEFLGPLAVALVASRRAVDFVWIGCAMFGLSLLLPVGQVLGRLAPFGALASGFAGQGLDPGGVGYILAAACLWAAYIVFGKRVSHLHGGQAVALGLSAAALVVLPFGLAHAGPALFRVPVLVYGIGIAILSSAIPYSLEMVALRHLPRQTFGILLSLEPAVGALVALVLLGERLSDSQWLAICSIIVASVGSTLTAPCRPIAIDDGGVMPAG